MKRTLVLSAIGAILSLSAFGQTKVDTLYYDKDWKGVADKIFATYVRVAVEPDDPHFAKRCRDFYVTGEIQGESNFISIDKYDDSKSVFDGEWIKYFKSGDICEHGYRVNGVMDGEYFMYNENGIILQHAVFKDGRLNGTYAEFLEDRNLYKVIEYENGTPSNDYYTITDFDRMECKVNIFDDQPIEEDLVAPSRKDMMTLHIGDQPWRIYDMNGIILEVTCHMVDDYGKYLQVNLSLTNCTLFPIQFGLDNVSAFYNDASNASNSMKILSTSEYIGIVAKKQKRKMSSNRFWENEHASNMSTTTTTINTSTRTTNSGTTSSYASASATSGSYGSTVRGSAYGNSNYYGNTSTNTSSTTYTQDAMAKQIAYEKAQNNIENYNNQLLSDRETKEEAYLKWSTIQPGETLSGFANIEYQNRLPDYDYYSKKPKPIILQVNVNGFTYEFPFQVSGNKNNIHLE